MIQRLIIININTLNLQLHMMRCRMLLIFLCVHKLHGLASKKLITSSGSTIRHNVSISPNAIVMQPNWNLMVFSKDSCFLSTVLCDELGMSPSKSV